MNRCILFFSFLVLFIFFLFRFFLILPIARPTTRTIGLKVGSFSFRDVRSLLFWNVFRLSPSLLNAANNETKDRWRRVFETIQNENVRSIVYFLSFFFWFFLLFYFLHFCFFFVFFFLSILLLREFCDESFRTRRLKSIIDS